MTIRRIVALLVLVAAAPLRAMGPVPISQVIDARLKAYHAANGIVAAPAASDAEFFRRLSIDLLGRIPTADEAHAFLNDPRPDKRNTAIEACLVHPDHVEHFANVWRGLLLPEAETDRQIRYFLPGFEAWLKQHRSQGSGFDVLVRELIAVPIDGTTERPQLVLRDLRAPNPLAFLATKEADPARLAATTVRLFLGIRLECAQCHNHPFDTWTQEQFWNQAAFFGGVQRRGRGPFAPVFEVAEARTIPIMGSEARSVPAQYLDSGTVSTAESPRVAFAQWITSRDNPYFARAAVNRIWGQFFGYGIVDPVDDFHDANPPSHPELLEELAAEFANSGFNLTSLYRHICRSQAYQRTSRQTSETQDLPGAFARMAVKPLSGDQFFASLVQAVGLPERPKSQSMARNEDPVRRRFLDTFGSQGELREPDTSVVQALTLMNGPLIHQATSANSGRVAAVGALGPAQAIEQLYLATFSRLPNAEEQRRLLAYLESPTESPEVATESTPEPASETQRRERLGDILWMLLNSAEFRWNH